MRGDARGKSPRSQVFVLPSLSRKEAYLSLVFLPDDDAVFEGSKLEICHFMVCARWCWCGLWR